MSHTSSAEHESSLGAGNSGICGARSSAGRVHPFSVNTRKFHHQFNDNPHTHMSLNIAIIDDNGDAREGLAALVRLGPGNNLVSVCRSGRSALVELPLTRPAVVLIEMDLRDLPGPDCIRRLRRLIPGVEIIVFAARLELPRIVAAMAAGAHGYLLRDSSPQRVLEAIQEVAAGGAPLAPAIARCLVEHLYTEQPGVAERARLSQREQQVLWRLSDGLRNKEVATVLNISTYTVQTHVRNIYAKMGVRSIAQAVARFFRSEGHPPLGGGS